MPFLVWIDSLVTLQRNKIHDIIVRPKVSQIKMKFILNMLGSVVVEMMARAESISR